MREEHDFEYSLSLKAAWNYYIEDMTQQQISDAFGMSRMRIIKLLEYARQNGIIQFHFRSGDSHRMQLEQKLLRRWNLQDVFVVPINHASDNIDRSIGRAAAMYLADRIHEDCYVNWGHGRTLNHMLTSLLQICEHHLSIVSLTGGVDYYLPDVRSSYNNANMHVIPAPLIMSSPEAAQILRKERPVQEIFNMIGHSTMTVIGIGSMSPSATLITKGTMTYNDFLLLKMQGAKGDILSHFIDENGEKVHSFFEDRMVAISLETLKELPGVIGVAGGVNKADAIHAVLKGGYLNKLIIDEETAGLVLEMDEDCDPDLSVGS